MTPVPDAAPADEARRYPSTIGGAVYLAILGATITGLVIVVVGSWRHGVGWIGSALIAAALARLAFGDADAGMLKVRGRIFDAALLAATGAVVILLAATIPNQPG
ncbi:DUF3017 domain-containing protein [Nocardioides sp.]|uniref:DUF3017 domain-containing protein n=1 Tax=Nocardioides sp. TaxID=35761 RepID=UPI00273770C1|nr:DUF3017 domain-containing protein [Nocardioides sp.]MDP3893286.1 DUF3017 domain-containing protein [Nocardioides sp.]